MNSDKLQDRLGELRREISYHNYRYHVLDDPVISDFEFDQLLRELRQIEEENPDLITPDSPTQRTGGQLLERFTKLRHPAPILSLGNAFDADDVRAWYERIRRLDERVSETDFVVEPKLDGLTVVLHYREGLFSQGATRGDGEIGEDITANLRTIRALPLRIPIQPEKREVPPNIVVRGEAFIFLKDFEELNRRLEEAGEKTYLNPRNTAAGSLRQLDTNLTASRPLTLLTYDIVSSDGIIFNSQVERLRYLHDMGFPVVEWTYCDNLEATIEAGEKLAAKRLDLPYEADGVVIKINNIMLADDLGVVGKDPRGAIAFKFPAQEVTTQLLEIRVNVGRTGVLTPYAVLEPVEISGVIVRQATLHNFDYISEKDIRAGDRVLVKRAGDVIPYVIGPVVDVRSENEKTFIPPEYCPVCNQPVEHLAGEVAWYCVNAACPEQLIRNIEHYVSRGAMDIVGLGIKIVEQLVNANLVQDVADLYTLSKGDLLELEGFAEKKANNILEAIQASKGQNLGRLITALGIRGVGSVSAAALAKRFNSLDKLRETTCEELLQIEGIGPNIAQAIVDWFATPSNQSVLEKLKDAGIWPLMDVGDEDASIFQSFSGLTFVITGTLSAFTRQEAREFIEKRGGKVTSSISKNTHYLVLGSDPGSKYEKAQKLGVQIIDEIGLRQMAS
jgi:DNA ligase (NAD+)